MTPTVTELALDRLHSIRSYQALDADDVWAVDFAIELLEAVQGVCEPQECPPTGDRKCSAT